MAKKILVVDDEKDTRNIVKRILEDEGYKVTTAVDGDDCLKKVKKDKPDLILLDIMMPGTPVDEVVKKIKDIKIIYFTIVPQEIAKKRGLMSDRVVGYIEKPFDVDVTVNMINNMLGVR